MKQFIFLLAVAFFSVNAYASNYPFVRIQCLDANKNMRAPVYVDIKAKPHNRMGFDLGNLVEYTPGKWNKSATVLGEINSTQSNGDSLVIQGSFASILRIQKSNQAATISGFVKYDPATGKHGGVNLKSYPLQCVISWNK